MNRIITLSIMYCIHSTVYAGSIDTLQNLLTAEHANLSDKRLNTLYKPSTMTVLYGRDLSLQGIDTVAEAMNLVPGMFTGVDSDLVVRGLEKNWGSSNIMMMLNNQPVNSTLIAYPTHLLKMPVEMIERIEVVRGPGAELSTEFAISASINIITRSNQSMYVKYGEFNRMTVGSNYSTQNTQLNFAFAQGDNSEFVIESDSLVNNPAYQALNPDLFEPRQVHDAYQRYYLTYAGQHQKWSWSLQRFEEQRGDEFGLAYIQPPADLDSTKIDTTTTANIRYNDLELSYHRFELDYQNMRLAPPGFTDLTSESDRYKTQGMMYSPSVSEDRWTLHYDWTHTLNKHTFSLRPYYTTIQANQGYIVDNDGQRPMFDGSYSRKIFGVLAHNNYALSKHTNLSYSLRHDTHSDLASTTGGHLGFVTQLNARNHLKGYLTQSYRLPTFLEKYYPSTDPLMKGDKHLESTRIRSAELMWIHDPSNYKLKLAGFFNEYDGLLTTRIEGSPAANDPIFYQQFMQLDSKMYAKGLELELKKSFTPNLTFDFNATYQVGDNESSEMIRSPQWLSNTLITYRFNPQWKWINHYQYIDSMARIEGDNRADFAHQNIYNTSVIWSPSQFKNLRLTASIRDVFNESQCYPSVSPYTYVDGMPKTGRTWRLTAMWDF